MLKIKRAIISVSNKKGIVEFAEALHAMGIEILSTGGTAKSLRDAGVPVKDVSEHTGSPEMLDGRVKTLHPKIHGGLLSRRDNPKDMEEIKKHGIDAIDMVVVNLYPFEETIAKPGVTFDEAIENIDIGGPAMLRSASKNFKDVAVIVDPSDYERVITEMRNRDGDLTQKTRLDLAKKVFRHTSRYDSVIAEYLTKATENVQ
jgi:phosphoribosylaminoimidazolecarboxamide formyltransferase/IMP cyclohydrolase